MPIPIPDSELIHRVISNAGRHVTPMPRWGAITRLFAVGSTYAAQLCRDHGFDPDEQVGIHSNPDEE